MKEKTILTLIALLAGFVNVWADDTPSGSWQDSRYSISFTVDYDNTSTIYINNAGQLAFLAAFVNSNRYDDNDNVIGYHDFEGKTIKINANVSSLDLSDHYWDLPIGTAEHPFKGTFDFEGKTISGIINDPSESIGGLFGYIGEGGCVKGLKLENSHLCGKNYVGGIAAYNNGGTITDCVVEGDVTVSATATGTTLGGIVGANTGPSADKRGRISGCACSAAFIKAENQTLTIGGLAGDNGYSHIEYCLYLGTKQSLSGGYVMGDGPIGGTADYTLNMSPIPTSPNNQNRALLVKNSNTAVTVNYQGTPTASYSCSGINAYNNVDGMCGIWYNNVYYSQEGRSVKFTVTPNDVAYNVTSVSLKRNSETYIHQCTPDEHGIYAFLLDGTLFGNITILTETGMSNWPGGGSGTKGDPYKISTTAHWEDFVRVVKAGYSFSGKYVKLENDIQFDKWEWGFNDETGPQSKLVGTPDYPFKGTFMGNNKKLTFNISGQVCYIAPFRYIDGATIKDLIIDGTIMNSQAKYDWGRYTAGLVANALGTCEISNCVVMGTVHSVLNSAASSNGGFIANISSGHTNMCGCAFIGNFFSNGAAGGLVGYVHSGAGLSLEACLFAPKNITSGTANSCRTLARSSATNTIVNIFCSLYTQTLGEAEGTPCEVTAVPFTDVPPVDYGFVKWYEGQGIYYSINNVYYKISERTSYPDIELSNGSVNSGLLALYMDRTQNVTITGRKLNAGKWNTLCLPFDVSADQIANETSPLYRAEIRELDFTNSYDEAGVIDNNVDDDYYTHYDTWEEKLYLYFKQATEIKAGKPYIVKPKSLIENPTFNSVKITRSSAFIESGDVGVFFVGNFDPTPLETDNTYNLYLGSDNKLYYPGTNDFKVNAFRAYFLVDSSDAGASESDDVRSIYLNFGDDEPSVVRDIDNGQWKTDNVVYDLNGRKVNAPLKKGIYIRNGRKVVIK